MSRIWVPKFKIAEPDRNILLGRARMKGRFQLRAVKRDGVTVDRQTEWFDNTIVDNGLNTLATTPTVLGGVAVGTGTTAPTTSDTAMEAHLAHTTDLQTGSSSASQNSSSPYELTCTVVYRFAQGAAEGTLTEVGVNTVHPALWSRELIRDGGGSPTSFPVTADEFLDVAYQLIIYPPLGDTTGTISISGSGSHDYVARAVDIVSGWETGIFTAANVIQMVLDNNTASHVCYSGAIGAITASSPAGSSNGGFSSRTNDAYSDGTFQRTGSYSLGLTHGNVGGIASTMVYFGNSFSRTGTAKFQYSYSPAIPKDSTKLLTLGYQLDWGRV